MILFILTLSFRGFCKYVIRVTKPSPLFLRENETGFYADGYCLQTRMRHMFNDITHASVRWCCNIVGVAQDPSKGACAPKWRHQIMTPYDVLWLFYVDYYPNLKSINQYIYNSSVTERVTDWQTTYWPLRSEIWNVYSLGGVV